MSDFTNPKSQPYVVTAPAASASESGEALHIEVNGPDLGDEDFKNMEEIERVREHHSLPTFQFVTLSLSLFYFSKELANIEGVDEYDDVEDDEDDIPEEMLQGKNFSRSGSQPYLPTGAVPSVNGKLSTHAAEFWFPESRGCKCCKGFKYGCDCTKNGFIACQEAGCVEPSNVGKKAVAQKAADSPKSYPSPNSGSQVMCKFELAPGGCRFGTGCRFKHQNAATQGSLESPKGDSRIPCTYFMRGNCEFGDKCRFAHF